MTPNAQRQSQHGRRLHPALAGPLQRPEPAKVTLQVVGRDTLEPCNPLLEPTVIRVDVLNVPGPPDFNSRPAEISRLANGIKDLGAQRSDFCNGTFVIVSTNLLI